MNFKKIALGVIGILAVVVIGYFVKQNSSNTRKFCSPVAGVVVCHECSCPMGKPIPGAADGVESVACPDSATPVCRKVEN